MTGNPVKSPKKKPQRLPGRPLRSPRLRFARRQPIWTESQTPLHEWYASGLGQSILGELECHLDGILPGIFGYQGLQIGSLAPGQNLLEKAGIHRGIRVDSTGGTADAGADVLNLPIASDVMKLVVLPHTLDFCHQPHQALREADRVLTDDGQIVLVGFNPLSLYGVGHTLLGWRDTAPWNGQFYSRRRVTEWLSVLDYRVLDSTCLYVRPPINSLKLQRKMSALEKLQPWIGAIGALYVLHARKQTVPMTMVRRQWRRSRPGISVGGLAANRHTGARQATSKIIQLPTRGSEPS